MSRFEVQPGWRRRGIAIFLALIAIASLALSERASLRIMAAVLLLAAWELAFLPTLPFNLTLGDVYQRARQGWRMSLMSRIINYVTVGLTVVAIYLQFKGR